MIYTNLLTDHCRLLLLGMTIQFSPVQDPSQHAGLCLDTVPPLLEYEHLQILNSNN